MKFGKAIANASVKEFTVNFKAIQYTGNNFDIIKEFIGRNAISFEDRVIMASIEFEKNSITPYKKDFGL